MIEIPLTARYTIASSQKRSWFVSAGGTSYIMQKEDYDYTYYYGNSVKRNFYQFLNSPFPDLGYLTFADQKVRLRC